MNTQGRKLDIVVSLRLDPRDFARLLKCAKESGIVFDDRASLLRHSYQEYLKMKNIPELTTDEALSLVMDEKYIKTPRQKIIRKMTEEIERKRLLQVQELLDENENVDLDNIFEGLPEEEENEKEEEK